MKILYVITQSEFGGAQRYLFNLVTNLNLNADKTLVSAQINADKNENQCQSAIQKISVNQRYKKSALISDIKNQHQSALNIIVAAGPQGDDQNGLLYALEQKGIKTYHLKHLTSQLHPIKNLLAFFELRRLIKKESPDILQLQSTVAGFLGSLAALGLSRKITDSKQKITEKKKVKLPKVIYRIGGWAFRDPRPWWYRRAILWTEKISAPWKETIIVNSEFDKRVALEKKICPEEKIKVIRNGIDLKNIKFLPKDEARSDPNLRIHPNDPNKIIMGCIANFYPTKGLKYLIEAVHLLNTSLKFQVSSFKFIIIGDGAERKKLESLIKKYKLREKVLLPGQIPNASQYLKAFDIFVLPSVKEGSPFVILEAMTAGIPIVATEVGGVPELIENEKNGFLVPPKNPKMLAEKILELTKAPQLQKKFVQAGKKKLKEFTLEKMVAETKKLY